MEYLLVMALSGSTMTCLYLLVRRLLRERLCAGTYYLLAKAAVLYYLIPLPFLKSWYREAVPETLWRARKEDNRIPLVWTRYEIHTEMDHYVNVYTVIQMTLAVVWLLGVCTLLTRRLIAYLRITRRLAVYAEAEMTERERIFVDSLRKEYGVRRRVSLIPAQNGESTITFGIRRPVIICGRETDSREAELLARHEMVHIKRLDVLWKILMEFTTFLHWWNPLAWMLHRSFEHVCECSCDEAVMYRKTEDEVKEYLHLLIEEAREKKSKETSLRWKAGFTGNAKYIRERMNNLMRKHKWNRIAAGALMATLIFANSMTVFAYRDGFSEVLPEDASQEAIERALNNDGVAFVWDETGEVADHGVMYKENTALEYDLQFTDEEGNVYPVYGDEGISTYCNHVYDPGTLQEHGKTSGGGCRVDEYRAERCIKCGQVIRGEWVNTYTWAICPH